MARDAQFTLPCRTGDQPDPKNDASSTPAVTLTSSRAERSATTHGCNHRDTLHNTPTSHRQRPTTPDVQRRQGELPATSAVRNRLSVGDGDSNEQHRIGTFGTENADRLST
jgi:hypothetical protein